MQLHTFLKTGIEVLHLGTQHTEANAWPLEHWRANKGRWRLYTPAIDSHVNRELSSHSFGTGVEAFVLFLEIADFASWGGPPAFHPPGGRVSYKPRNQELLSVAQIDWLQVQNEPLTKQYRAYCAALNAAVQRAITYRRCPKYFEGERFAAAVALAISSGRASAFTRAAQSR